MTPKVKWLLLRWVSQYLCAYVCIMYWSWFYHRRDWYVVKIDFLNLHACTAAISMNTMVRMVVVHVYKLLCPCRVRNKYWFDSIELQLKRWRRLSSSWNFLDWQLSLYNIIWSRAQRRLPLLVFLELNRENINFGLKYTAYFKGQETRVLLAVIQKIIVITGLS